jgi:hypothetical protein
MTGECNARCVPKGPVIGLIFSRHSSGSKWLSQAIDSVLSTFRAFMPRARLARNWTELLQRILDCPARRFLAPGSAQSPGKSYRLADDFSRRLDGGIWAEWEAGFRLTGIRKPATDGVSGLFAAVALPSSDSHDRTYPDQDFPSRPW